MQTEAQIDHDRNVARARQVNLKLNKSSRGKQKSSLWAMQTEPETSFRQNHSHEEYAKANIQI